MTETAPEGQASRFERINVGWALMLLLGLLAFLSIYLLVGSDVRELYTGAVAGACVIIWSAACVYIKRNGGFR